ncbi:MAG: 3-deoxy-D-manno-octulosonic acid transferase [Rhodobacteraceae bacterium]|jgi:3-deoxy-D-manno-octulosonic-acid transferase|nr:3-deoxy-D-manno-octulosonic acid transferase [Paracoccaceae bacterium]
MAVSLGRTLYNLGRRPQPGNQVAPPPRPDGTLVWLNVPGATSAPGMAELARRLVEEDGISILVTTDQPFAPQNGMIVQPPPTDAPGEARAFLDHWRPDAGVFAEGEVRPALVLEAAARKVPLLMVEARMPELPRDRGGWFPGRLRSALAAFSAILALDEAAARAFRKAGAAAAAVILSGRMAERSAALPGLEAEREALARLVAARPVWFAAAVPEAGEPAVLAANRAALRLAHRLLLILMPERPERAGPLSERLEAEGWLVAQRALDQEPERDTEIYVVDNPAEIGLWYRLAPVTFLGGSLAGEGAVRNPLEAAALGSAILHGPRPGAHGTALGRLGLARAARSVSSTADLAAALSDILAPDRAARLAQAAWAVASDGAEVTQDIMDRIRAKLDGGR